VHLGSCFPQGMTQGTKQRAGESASMSGAMKWAIVVSMAAIRSTLG
jgi:hypothetical protein